MQRQAAEARVVALCENCGLLSRQRCSRCKAFAVCSTDCMKVVWPRHKADCNNAVEARKLIEATGTPVHGVPCAIAAEDLQHLNARTLEVYRRHGVSEPPERGSTMDVNKKLAFFLDVLREHDTSSPQNANLSMPEKLFLNRRYNNTYRHAVETFTGDELNRLNSLMHQHHVGVANP